MILRTIYVHNMFSKCSAKMRASDKDLPVMEEEIVWRERILKIAQIIKTQIHSALEIYYSYPAKKITKFQKKSVQKQWMWCSKIFVCLKIFPNCSRIVRAALAWAEFYPISSSVFGRLSFKKNCFGSGILAQSVVLSD